jgi:hypothetical protein
MGLFGGDPRFVHLQLLLRFNVYYDAVIIPLFVIMGIRAFGNLPSTTLLFVFSIIETLRIWLNSSHSHGDIPRYVAFLLLTFPILMFVEFLWLFISPHRAGFDITCRAGYLMLHLLELLSCVPAYRSFKQWQTGFYQFARGISIRNDQMEVSLDELPTN